MLNTFAKKENKTESHNKRETLGMVDMLWPSFRWYHAMCLSANTPTHIHCIHTVALVCHLSKEQTKK